MLLLVFQKRISGPIIRHWLQARNASEKSFLKSVSWIYNLRVRAGLGKSANQAVAPYATLGNLALNNYNLGNAVVTGFYVSVLPNPGLKWETTTTTDFGVDFGFFKNRL